MCGIAGIVAPESRRFREVLSRMVSVLAHRGPDGSGEYFFDNCCLGHARLSIIDLETGQQPMLSADKSKGITYNGEIYGYRDIRDSMTIYPFQTKSDTEVVLGLHDMYGTDLFRRLPGMFAFGIWDEKSQTLLCGRDRFGEKPLYYCFGPDNEFLFSSEIKALLASGLIRPVVDLESVGHYLKYLYVHPHRSIYRNIHTLPPGHYMVYRGGSLTVQRYWSLPGSTSSIGMGEAVPEFKRLLSRSVALQLVADVDVGLFLSGGLDSSTIVALASRHRNRVKTFSFDFEDSASELPYAREVAGMYGTDHIELGDRFVDIADLLWEMQKIYDEPFADSSSIPTFLISKLARRHVKVVLTGDGGDETMGGYSYWYKPLLRNKGFQSPRHWGSDSLHSIISMLRSLGGPFPVDRMRDRMIGMLYRSCGLSVEAIHSMQRGFFSDRQLKQVFPSFPGWNHLPFPGERRGTVDDAMRMDITDYLPGDILVKTDRASMANGLELRSPFLDVDFASFCITLPVSLKIDEKKDKKILRKAFSADWPPSVQRRGKQGFGAPVGRWLKRPSLKALKDRYLRDDRQKIFSMISFRDTRGIVERDNYNTWALLVLALWMDRHLFDVP